MIRTAILIDGGFYRKRAKVLWGKLTPKERAIELIGYSMAHIGRKDGEESRFLYRIFYYDCEPVGRRSVFNPLVRKNVDLDKTETYEWTRVFYDELKKKRKVALRLGNISDQLYYNIKPEVTKELLLGKRELSSLDEDDMMMHIQQKGVDMRIGIDIASLAYKKQVDQIILVSGDSDFVPASKLARREGIDFVLDPMYSTIREDLFEHVDGIEIPWKRRNQGEKD